MQFSDDVKPLSDSDLYRVRGVPGVAWAVRLYKGLTRSRLEDGNFQQTILLGLDDATLVGAPPNMIVGNIVDLRKPDAVIMDLEGYKLLWPDEEPRIGKRFEMNDREAEIVGICKASRTFQTFPVVYTRYSQALEFVPPERKVLSFVLAEALNGRERRRSLPPDRRADGHAGRDRPAVRMDHDGLLHGEDRHPVQLRHHGGCSGFIVGTAIAAQTFYLFTIENIKQYGALKAMGAGNLTLLGMILLQALLVSFIGFGLGIGAATWFGKIANCARLAAGVLHAVEVFVGVALAVGGDQRAVEFAEHAARDGGRAGRGVSRLVKSMGNRMAMLDDNPLVTCRDVTKVYGSGNAEVHALRGVDLDVYAGELTMLVGPSGCGKTTLLSVLAGILRPTGGTVDVLGTDLTQLSSWQRTAFRRDNVGFVFQQFNLLPALTAAENAAVPLVIQGLLEAEGGRRGEGAARQDGHGRPRRTICRASSPAASSSAWPSPGRWSIIRICWCATSRPRRSTPRRATRFWNCCGTSPSKATGP